MTLEPPYDCAKCQRMHYSNSGIYDNHLMYNATFYPNPKPEHSVQKAENGIRDMFLDKQYKGVVPDKDIDHALNSKRWQRFYGRSYLFKAWEELINNGHVRRKGADWQWNFDPKTGKFRWAFPNKNRVRVRANPRPTKNILSEIAFYMYHHDVQGNVAHARGMFDTLTDAEKKELPQTLRWVLHYPNYESTDAGTKEKMKKQAENFVWNKGEPRANSGKKTMKPMRIKRDTHQGSYDGYYRYDDTYATPGCFGRMDDWEPGDYCYYHDTDHLIPVVKAKANPYTRTGQAYVQLQSVGRVPAKPAKDFKVGERIMWNFGEESLIIAIIKETPKTLVFKTESSGKTYRRRYGKDRLLAIGHSNKPKSPRINPGDRGNVRDEATEHEQAIAWLSWQTQQPGWGAWQSYDDAWLWLNKRRRETKLPEEIYTHISNMSTDDVFGEG